MLYYPNLVGSLAVVVPATCRRACHLPFDARGQETCAYANMGMLEQVGGARGEERRGAEGRGEKAWPALALHGKLYWPRLRCGLRAATATEGISSSALRYVRYNVRGAVRVLVRVRVDCESELGLAV